MVEVNLTREASIMIRRRITITNSITNEKWEMPFFSDEMKDSEALHYMLCMTDPGDDYTIHFWNEEI